MAKKRITKKNARRILLNIASRIETDEDEEASMFCDSLNAMLDDLLEQDAFGTEGQCDPRGDHRE